MVIRDISDWEGRAPNAKSHHEAVRIAFVSDRFIATILDFLIFSPVISFATAGFVKKIKTYLILNPQSDEATLVWIMCVAFSVCLVVLLQACFIFFWQATPGQKFMQLKVIAYPGRFEALSFSQCLLRSLMWLGSFVFFGAPFLEIIGHPLRRAFHERASDTMVITKKAEYDLGPLPIERKFVGSWTRMFFLALFLMGTLWTFKTYNTLQRGQFASIPESQAALLCVKIPAKAASGARRLDLALAMFLADEASEECLAKEADFALWNTSARDGEERSWAYLARALVTEDKAEQDQYFAQACRGQKKAESCTLAKILADESDTRITKLPSQARASVTARMLVLDEKLAQQKNSEAISLMDDLQGESLLKSAIEKRTVRLAWSIRANDGGSRRPASLGVALKAPAKESSTLKFMLKFKEKYGLP